MVRYIDGFYQLIIKVIATLHFTQLYDSFSSWSTERELSMHLTPELSLTWKFWILAKCFIFLTGIRKNFKIFQISVPVNKLLKESS